MAITRIQFCQSALGDRSMQGARLAAEISQINTLVDWADYPSPNYRFPICAIIGPWIVGHNSILGVSKKTANATVVSPQPSVIY